MIETNIGFFGGTFNPIHRGHTKVATRVLSLFNLDGILFVPSYIPPHKTVYIDPEKRFKMVELAMSENEKFSASRIEINLKGYSYTADTLKYFLSLEENKNKSLYFIIGSDSFIDIESWEKHELLLPLCKFIVVSRPAKYELIPDNAKRCLEVIKRLKLSYAVVNTMSTNVTYGSTILEYDATILITPRIDISSTKIRRMIKNERSPKHLVTKAVLDYICEHGLYADPEF